MSEVLYEQYKDALRRGHTAALRGRLDVAAAAYREASRIAPDRALPYVGLGGVLSRLGKAEDALTAYGNALDRAPTDEGAMHGRPTSWPLSVGARKRPRRSTALPRSSSATAVSLTPATSRAAHSSWQSPADGAGRSRASSPGSAQRHPRMPPPPTPFSARWGSWTRGRA